METDDILARSLKHNFWTWSAQRNPDVIPVEKPMAFISGNLPESVT